jgi:putative DNA primase/helicase
MLGDGSNGKGVVSQVAEAVMPPGSCCAIPPQDFSQEYRRALLAGKLLNVVSELPEADILESESFKDVIAGDSTTGREIRQSPFTFRPIAGHLFSANRLPGTVDQTHGFWRRFVLVTFNRTFLENEQDPELAERLINEELPAIVAWFLAGAQRVQLLKHYTIPASHAAALEKWKQNADQILSFIEAKCDRLEPNTDEHLWEPADGLYQRYRTWAGDNGHKALASNKFAERMRLLKLAGTHTRNGNFYPVRLRPNGADYGY